MRLGAIILAVCLALGVVEAGQLMVGSGDLSEPRPWLAFWRAVPSWLILAGMSPLAVWTSDRWPVRGDAWLNALVHHLVVAVPFAATHLAVAALWGGLRPGSLGLSFGESFDWLLTRYLVYGLLSYGALVGVVHAYRYHREVQARDRESAALLKELELARLRATEGKLHPHFVFNTLNAITGLAARGDQRGVADTLEAFGELLQATLDDQDTRVVPLREELDLLDSYVGIQRVRFGERLRFRSEVSDEALDDPVPGLLLQPLVENALTHGIGLNRAGGEVTLTARRTADGLEVEVSDTGPGPAGRRGAGGQGRGIGLDATRSRLKALFGEGASLQLKRRADGGTTARVFIPGRPGGKGEGDHHPNQ